MVAQERQREVIVISECHRCCLRCWCNDVIAIV